MKQVIHILLIVFLSSTTLYFYSHDIYTNQNDIKIKKEQYKDIINFITYRSYTSSFCFYFLINYCCDSFLTFQKQENIVTMIHTLKKIGLYLILLHSIKNYIYQLNKDRNTQHINENIFSKQISEILPYSLDETTLYTLKFYYELKNYLHSLNEYLIIKSEEFILLGNTTNINLQTALYITQNDASLHQKIKELQINQEINLVTVINSINREISQSFINLEKHVSNSNIQFSTIL